MNRAGAACRSWAVQSPIPSSGCPGDMHVAVPSTVEPGPPSPMRQVCAHPVLHGHQLCREPRGSTLIDGVR